MRAAPDAGIRPARETTHFAAQSSQQVAARNRPSRQEEDQRYQRATELVGPMDSNTYENGRHLINRHTRGQNNNHGPGSRALRRTGKIACSRLALRPAPGREHEWTTRRKRHTSVGERKDGKAGCPNSQANGCHHQLVAIRHGSR